MRYAQIPSTLFVNHRKQFCENLPEGTLCVIHSNDIAYTNGDGTRPFIQNSNLFWLTGIEQEDTTLLLYPDNPRPEHREVLFIKQRSEHTDVWEGHKLSYQEATEISGIRSIFWGGSFRSFFRRIMASAELISLTTDHHPGNSTASLDRNHRFALWCRREYPLHRYHNAVSILHSLRMVKSEEEVALLRKSAEITQQAFIATCRAVKPGMYEYELEAEWSREILRQGARGFAYTPIIASGERSCILHYSANDHKCHQGDLVLMDVGASYGNYAADMTRTIPVSGRFSARQRAVYDAVLRIFRGAVGLMRPGTKPSEYHNAVDEMVDKELVDLGLVTPDQLRLNGTGEVRKKYFPHKTTHFLGLDVHDPGDLSAPFEAGMVLTCEPGIYLREEGIGVRIENDILITVSGNQDFMGTAPITTEEIEALLAT